MYNVKIEDEEILSDFDIWLIVGKNSAYNMTTLVSISDGMLNIAFNSIKDNAKISAIKVVKPDDHTGINQRHIPVRSELGQNYPNPFNDATTIPYQLSMASDVKIAIYNFLGQHIATLIDERQAAGDYRATWKGTDKNGNAVAGGIYFCRLETSQNPQQQ